MKSIKLYIFLIIFSLTVPIFSIIYLKFNIKEKVGRKIDIYEGINIFTDKKIYKSESGVYVGNSQKQLENGYFDMLIQYEKDKLIVTINSLKKENNEGIYDELYVDEVISYLNEKYKKVLDTERLKEAIVSMYLNLRSSLEEKSEELSYKDEDINVSLKLENFKLIIVLKEELV
ncbi:MAG: hypothetical protein IJ809_04490 [Clostridia bacterium]|nr:hypothetical protein [Clostridia bacterium]